MIDRVYTFPIRKRSARKVASIFGSNIHIKYGDGTTVVNNYPQNQTISTYIATAKDLGIGWYRTNCTNATDASRAAPYFDAFRAAGIEPFCVIDADLNSYTGTYASNYSAGKTLGTAIGAALKGHCLYFETSNERDFYCRIDTKDNGVYRYGGTHVRSDGTNVDGSRVTDYDPTARECFMGWNTGVADGLKVNIPDAIYGFATGAGYGYVFANLLHFGTATIGGPQVRTPCPQGLWGSHWYMNMYDPTKSKQQDGTVVDVLGLYNTLVPGAVGFITEWGLMMDETTQASSIPMWCHTWYSNRLKYNIAGAFIYAQYPNPSSEGDTPTSNWGLNQSDGVTKRAGYTAYKNFISNPY